MEDIRNRTDVEQVKFAPHPSIPFEEVGFKYYHSAQAHMKFINKDGTFMEFKNHFFATNNSAHQDYLDEEIQRHRNLMLSYASDEEVTAHKMRIDPKGTITQQIVDDPDAMAELKWTIENKVRRDNGLPEVPAPEGSQWGAGAEFSGADQFSDKSLEKIQGVDKSKGGDNSIQTPTGKVTLEGLKANLPPTLTPSSTTSLPGAHTPGPDDKVKK